MIVAAMYRSQQGIDRSKSYNGSDDQMTDSDLLSMMIKSHYDVIDKCKG